MKLGIAVINDLCALVEQLINDLADHIFVTGDRRSRDYDSVARLNIDLTVLGECHAVKRRHGFTLAAGGNDDHLFLRQLIYLVNVHYHVFRDI